MKNNNGFARARRHGLRTLAAIALISFSSTALAALDMLLVIPGVTGESTDATFPGAINVLAWSWGDVRPSAPPALSCFQQDLSLTKYVDTATPPLLLGLVRGRIYPRIKLVIRSLAGAAPQDYITFEMINAQLTSLSTGGSGGEDRLTENISIHFLRPIYTYTPLTGGAPVIANVPACP